MSAVRLTQSARTDLLEAWAYIAEHNLDAADGVLDAIEREALLLATQPLMGRARPELGAGLRSWPTEQPVGLIDRGLQKRRSGPFFTVFCPIDALWGCKSGKNWSRRGTFSPLAPKVRQAAGATLHDFRP